MDYPIQDFDEMKAILREHFENTREMFWKMRTGSREKDWTLHEALAHLVAIAAALNTGIAAALNGEPIAHLEGVNDRPDLRQWNQREIEIRTKKPPTELLDELEAELNKAEATISNITEEESEATTLLKVYNRPARVVDMVDWQLSHPGAVHGSQIARPMNGVPIWQRLSPDHFQRLLDRYTRQFSYAYWHQYGGDQPRVVNFTVEGDSGGEWHLIASPDGGDVHQGVAGEADYHIVYKDAHTYLSVYTFHIRMQDALKSGDVRVQGDANELFSLLSLYTATPPKLAR
jgi:hypothetical protein